MKLSAILLAGVAFVAVAGAANAADLLIVDEPMAEIAMMSGHDWSGGYVGLFGGYGSGEVDWTADYSGNGVGTDVEGSFDASGWLLGVTAGANMQMDSFVLGVEGDIAWANISGEGTALDPDAEFPSVPSGTLDWVSTLRGRAGFAADNVLFYATGGLAFGGGEMSITNADDPGVTLQSDATYYGWAAGLGAEIALDDNISLKAEYLYTSLSSDDADFGLTDSGDLTAETDFGMHTVKLGVNIGF